MFLRNFQAVVREPGLGVEYVAYQLSRLRHGGRAERLVAGGVRVTGFSGFGEYHSCDEFVGPEESAYFTSCPTPAGAVVDIGANLGIVSVLLSRRFADRQVHAFEPNPHTIAALRHNLALNKCSNVVAHGEAVADRNGSISFEAHPTNRATTSIAHGDGVHAVMVPCTTLDTFMDRQGLDELALLKVDVEGYETTVLSGACRLLGERRVAIVFFEVAPALTIRAGFLPEEPGRMLQEAGYKLMRIKPDGSLYVGEIAEIQTVALENWVALRA